MSAIHKGSRTDLQKMKYPYRTCRKQWFPAQKGNRMKCLIKHVENDIFVQKGTQMDVQKADFPYKSCQNIGFHVKWFI